MESVLIEQGFNVTPQGGEIQLVMNVDGDDTALVRKANQIRPVIRALSR